MQQDLAETVGLQALAWIAANDELLPVFINASGSNLSDIRKGVQDIDLMASVLDFLLQDDDWTIAFCDATGLNYEMPMRARAALPGGEQVHWT